PPSSPFFHAPMPCPMPLPPPTSCSSLQTGTLISSPFSVDGLMGFGSGPRSVIRQLSSPSSPPSAASFFTNSSSSQVAAAAGTGAGAAQQEAVMPFAFSFCLDGGDTGGGHLAIGRSEQPADMQTAALWHVDGLQAGGGHLAIGRSQQPKEIQTAALWHVDGLPYHYINITNMSIGGRQVAGADSLSVVNAASLAGGVIIDSGTTFTALPPAVYTSLKDS
ncbi:unnamed protein product, partial [Closterium sp. Naga37s-1]